MPKNDEIRVRRIEEAAASCKSCCKKILASDGRLRGVYYYTGNSEDAALVVSLLKKDKTGSKTAQAGKDIRKLIRNAKFMGGTISLRSGKQLVFSLDKGNISAGEMRRGFRLIASKPGMGFL